MLNLLILLATSPVSFAQDAGVASDTARILGSDVPITFPASEPLPPTTASVSMSDWKWEVNSQGLSNRFRKDGGWGDIRDLYAKAKAAPNPKLLPIKVMIVQNSSFLIKSPAGVVRQVWQTIDDGEVETIKKSLATLKGSIQGITDGAFDAKFEVSLEKETYFAGFKNGIPPTPQPVLTSPLTLAESTADPARDLIQTYIAPQFNNERFDTDDGQNHGPFSAVIIIHPGLTLPDQITMVQDTPMATISYYGFSEESAETSLPRALVQVWQQTLVASAIKRGFNINLRNGPFVFAGPYWTALAERSLRQTPVDRDGKDFTLGDPKSVVKFPIKVQPLSNSTDGTVLPSPNSEQRALIDFDKLDFAAGIPNFQLPAITGFNASSSGSLWVEVDRDYKSLSQALSVEVPELTRKTVSNEPQVVGDFSATPKNGTGTEIKFLKPETRGHVVLSRGNPIIKKGQAGFLTFELTLAENENAKMLLRGKNGQLLAELLLGGDMETRGEGSSVATIDSRVPADNQAHTAAIPLDSLNLQDDVTEIWFSGGNDRITRGDISITISGIRVEATKNASASDLAPNPAIPVTQITGEANAEQTQELIQAVKNNSLTLKMTALDVLSRVKAPGAIQACMDSARSGFASVAFLAMNALAFQDSAEGWAAIREIVERGPFDHNRRFAASQLERKPDPAMAASLNMLSTKSWLARFAGVKALIAINSPSAQLIMSNLLGNEPNPAVRLQVIRNLDTTNSMISRKLLYSAVNDSSQWVRGLAYTKLLDSRDPKVFEEALKGVRDESVDVRIFILDYMRSQAKTTFRPALQLALGDPNPVVRVASIRAYASQPGDVSPSDLQSVMSDTDAEVRQALQDLATKKGWKGL